MALVIMAEIFFPTRIIGDYETQDGSTYTVTVDLGQKPMISLSRPTDVDTASVATVIATITCGRLEAKDRDALPIEVPKSFFHMEAAFSTFKNGGGDLVMLYRDVRSIR